MLSPDGDSHHTRSHLALEFVVLCDIEKKEGYAFPRTCGLAFPSLPGPRLAPAEGRSLNSRPLGMMICSVEGFPIIRSYSTVAFFLFFLIRRKITTETVITRTSTAAPATGIAMDSADAATVPADSAAETTGLAKPALTAVDR